MTAFQYLHTNLTVRDIDRMQAFYVEVFGCRPLREIHTLTGEWIEKITAVPGAAIKYVHLAFPGFDDQAPELELVQYLTPMQNIKQSADNTGFGHIAFQVENVETSLEAVLAAGGGKVGEIVSVDVPKRGRLTEVYATDPEGNIIELQCYSSISDQ